MDHASLEAATSRCDDTAAVNKRKKSRDGSVYIPWDTDNAEPDAPTSLDVLLRWLATPGNYGRLLSQSKCKSCREIIAALNAQGIGHRTPWSVRGKVDRMERQYKSARTWLLDSGHYDLYMRGGTSVQVEQQVERRCPQFRKLEAVIQGASLATEVSDTEEEDGGNADESHARDGDAKEVRRVKASPRTSRRPWAASCPDTSSNKRVKRVTMPPQASAPGVTLSGMRCGGFQAVHDVADSEAEAHERLLACDREREQALAICEIEGLLEQRNVRLVCETAIRRKKLIDAAVPQETIDSLVPPRAKAD